MVPKGEYGLLFNVNELYSLDKLIDTASRTEVSGECGEEGFSSYCLTGTDFLFGMMKHSRKSCHGC